MWTWRSSTTYNGRIRRVSFRKLQDSTALRLRYYTGVRMYNSGYRLRLYFKIDGYECSTPRKVDSYTRINYSGYDYQPTIVSGTCTHTGRGRINKGGHRVEVYVSSSDGNVNTGDSQTSELRVEEVCQSNQ